VGDPEASGKAAGEFLGRTISAGAKEFAWGAVASLRDSHACPTLTRHCHAGLSLVAASRLDFSRLVPPPSWKSSSHAHSEAIKFSSLDAAALPRSATPQSGTLFVLATHSLVAIAASSARVETSRSGVAWAALTAPTPVRADGRFTHTVASPSD
jgi:hypothetical protein